MPAGPATRASGSAPQGGTARRRSARPSSQTSGESGRQNKGQQRGQLRQLYKGVNKNAGQMPRARHSTAGKSEQTRAAKEQEKPATPAARALRVHTAWAVPSARPLPRQTTREEEGESRALCCPRRLRWRRRPLPTGLATGTRCVTPRPPPPVSIQHVVLTQLHPKRKRHDGRTLCWLQRDTRGDQVTRPCRAGGITGPSRPCHPRSGSGEGPGPRVPQLPHVQTQHRCGSTQACRSTHVGAHEHTRA